MPRPAHLRHYPAHRVVAWQPHGVLDDRLLEDEVGRAEAGELIAQQAQSQVMTTTTVTAEEVD